MNRLALALNMDPVELRMRNIIHEGSIASVGTPFPKGVSMLQVVERCATESVWSRDKTIGWQHPSTQQPSNPSLRRGVGFACGFKNVGYSFGFPEQSWATVEIHGNGEIEQVVVRAAGADVGQGAHTVFVQMAAEATGVPIDKVRLIGHDTAETNTSGSASASRLTFMAGNAIKGRG